MEANLQAALADTPRGGDEQQQQVEQVEEGQTEAVTEAGEAVVFVVGQRVLGQWGGGEDWYHGAISAVHEEEDDSMTFDVAYDDGDVEERKPKHQLAPEP
jgi:hypothetical protein